MSPTPKQSIDPSFIQDMDCPICGQDALQLKSMQRYPDYVACGSCTAQFVVEAEGERVMYGEIPATYPRTRRFALQQWAWPEAVARRAAEERPQQPATPPAPPAQEPTIDTPEPELEVEEPSPGSEPAAEESEHAPPEPVEPSTPIGEQPPEEEEPPPWAPPEEGAVEEATEDATWLPEEEEELEDETPLPPFAETAEEEADLLPGEDEPAPETPDWLSEPEAEAPEEPPEEPAIADESEIDREQDLFTDLWGEEEEAGSDVEPSEMSEEETSLDDFDFEVEEQDFEEPDASDDIWAESDQVEDEVDALAAFDELEEPDAEPAEGGLSDEELAELHWMGETAPKGRESKPPEDKTVQAQAGVSLEGEPAAVPGDDLEVEPTREAQEPPPGSRHRVVLKTSQPSIPDDMCAHCTQSPTVSRMSVPATIVKGSGLGERQVTTFRVPICADCKRRVNTRSEEQQTARLQAHLISLLMALMMVVGALAFQIVELEPGTLLVDLVVLALLAGMGYVVPAAFLLLRASRMPKPPDARYVESTLRVPSDTQGMETAFEWRNRDYAAHFLAANTEVAAGDVTEVKERQYGSGPEPDPEAS